MTTSIVSALTGRPCRSEVAMTGEIDLLGNIWPIGGLREKLLAAKRVGVKKVFVPIGNRHDVELIEKQFLRDLEIVFVSRAEEVLNEVLLPKTFDAAR